ncbi:MAG: hypothetical protein U0835_02360 [Isosphaeraceae bacterium]
MNNPLHAVSLRPFVPSGPDYPASRRFFRALGFEELWENSGCAGFRCGGAQFILQNFDQRAFAENFMVHVTVPDLDAWWEAVSALNLEASFPGVRLKPPTSFPWGREAHVIDPAGVCWHFGAG